MLSKELLKNKPIHVEILGFLLSKLPVDQFDQMAVLPQQGDSLKGITPLCLAAYLGKCEMAKTLLDAHVPIDSQDRNGKGRLKLYQVRHPSCMLVRNLLSTSS